MDEFRDIGHRWALPQPARSAQKYCPSKPHLYSSATPSQKATVLPEVLPQSLPIPSHFNSSSFSPVLTTMMCPARARVVHQPTGPVTPIVSQQDARCQAPSSCPHSLPKPSLTTYQSDAPSPHHRWRVVGPILTAWGPVGSRWCRDLVLRVRTGGEHETKPHTVCCASVIWRQASDLDATFDPSTSFDRCLPNCDVTSKGHV